MGSSFWLNKTHNGFAYLGSQTYAGVTGVTTYSTSVTVPPSDLIIVTVHDLNGYLLNYEATYPGHGLPPTFDSTPMSIYTAGSVTNTIALFSTYGAPISAGTYTFQVPSLSASNIYNITISYFKVPSTGYLNVDTNIDKNTTASSVVSVIIPTNTELLSISAITYQNNSSSGLSLVSNSDTKVYFGPTGNLTGSGLQYSIFNSRDLTAKSTSWVTSATYNWQQVHVVFKKQ